MLKVLFLSFTLIIMTSCGSSSKQAKTDKDKAFIYYTHGTQKLIDQDYTKALKLLSQAYELDDDNTKISNNLGMAYFFKGDTKTAIKYIKEAISIDEKNMDARNNLASIYFKSKQYDQALKEYKLIESNLSYDRQFRTYYNLALIYDIRRDFKNAIAYLKKSIKENQDYCPASFKLAMYAYEAEDYPDALNKFQEAQMGPCVQNPQPHFYKAMTLKKLGRNLEARNKFVEVQERFSKTKYFQLANRELKNLVNVSKEADYISDAKERLRLLKREQTFEGTSF